MEELEYSLGECMMDETVVQVIESSTDLTPVVERLDQMLQSLAQLQANTDYVFLAVCALIGVVLGCVVGWLLHDLWKA